MKYINYPPLRARANEMSGREEKQEKKGLSLTERTEAQRGLNFLIAGEILVQLAQRADQRARLVHDLRGEGVRLVFVAPRPPVRQRREPERDHARQQPEQQQRRHDAARLKAEAPIKPFLLREQRDQPEPRQRTQRRDRQHLGDVLLLEVADFVRQHRLQLRLGQLLDQRVEQHDLAEAAEAGEERVRVPGAFAAVHDLDAPGAEAGALGQLQQPLAQAAFGQRREFVEQRQDQHRRQHEHQQLKPEQRAPGPQPPPRPRSTRPASTPAPAADSPARCSAAAL